MEQRTAIPRLTQNRLQTSRKISYYLPPPNQLPSRDGTPVRTSPSDRNPGRDTSTDEFHASFQEFHTQVTHPDWVDKSTGSRRESQIFNHSLAPLGQTVGLQYTCTRIGVNYKLRACKKRNAC